MEYHRNLIEEILEAEGLEGFEKEQRRDELDHFSTEDLERVAAIYEE